MSLVMNQQKSYIFGLLGIFLSLMFFSCKTAKLSDAEEKHRIGEYYEAAAIYRKVYTIFLFIFFVFVYTNTTKIFI